VDPAHKPVAAAADPSRIDTLCRAIIETSPYLYCVLDDEGRFVFVNPASAPLLGYDPRALIGESALDYVHPDDLEVAAAALTQIVEEFERRPGEGVPMAVRLRAADGSLVDVEVGSAPRRSDPDVRGVILRARPMSGQQFLDRALQALVASSPLDQVLEFLVASLGHELTSSVATIAYEWDGRSFARRVSSGLPDLLTGGETDGPPEPWRKALVAGELLVFPNLESLPDDVAAEADALGLCAAWILPIRVPPTDTAPALLTIWRMVEGDPWVSHQVALARVSRLTALAFERRHSEERLRHAALHDTLTGVANRAQFFDRLLESATPERAGQQIAVLYLDLDGFKPVNDTHGHAAGDAVLQIVTERMVAAVRSGDLVARLGGDEFAVLSRDIADEAAAISLAERIIESVSRPMSINGSAITVGVSAGIALGRGEQPERLLEAADDALYEAKESGKGRWRLAGSRA
jgi:diguanylate cyclase (GGDEF)-like protein/PAS domain S-box-containing protein